MLLRRILPLLVAIVLMSQPRSTAALPPPLRLSAMDAMAPQYVVWAVNSAEMRVWWDQSDAYIGRMQTMVRNGFDELEQARKSPNIGRVNCVNEHLTTLKGLLRLAHANWASLNDGMLVGDLTRADPEFVKISIAFNSAEEAEGQLRACEKTFSPLSIGVWCSQFLPIDQTPTRIEFLTLNNIKKLRNGHAETAQT